MADGSVTREETASAIGLPRALTAFHLEKLVEAGLLEVAPDAPSSHARRRGRPSKRYRSARGELGINLPARDYRLAAELFADALTRGPQSEALDAVARDRGRAIGLSARDRAGDGSEGGSLTTALIDVLADRGYEPLGLDDGSVALRNCPFDGLTEGHGDLVCPANLALLDGMIEGAGITSLGARMEPGDGRCCVLLRAVEPPKTESAS